MNDKLIRRDTPLTAGMKVRVDVVTSYTVDVDDWLDGEPSITVTEIEEALRRPFGTHMRVTVEDSLRNHDYKGEYVEDTWHMELPSQVLCTCNYDGHQAAHEFDCAAAYATKIIDARFETPYEQEQRQRGHRYGEPPVYIEPGKVPA